MKRINVVQTIEKLVKNGWEISIKQSKNNPDYYVIKLINEEKNMNQLWYFPDLYEAIEQANQIFEDNR